MLVVIFWIYCRNSRRKIKRLKQKHLIEYGDFSIQRHQARNLNESVETEEAIKFTEEELKKATKNYTSQILGEGVYGTIYKGNLSDQREVAIRKPKDGAPPIIHRHQFFEEVNVLSQLRHKNVVRVIGCCVDTPTPLLVYEYISNGTLYDHLHNKRGFRTLLSWEMRMKIAADAATALAYLHYSTSTEIIHRDVQSRNILLDESHMAKLSDFGASRLIPENDQNRMSTLVQGTLGYLDPEYLRTKTLTEKSDVYSLGVVLVELLTSRVAFSFRSPEAERNLASFFVCLMEKDELDQILDHKILRYENKETVGKVADLANRCLKLKGRDRPSMQQVAVELEGLKQTIIAENRRRQANFSRSPNEILLESPQNFYDYAVHVMGEGDGI